MRESQKKEKRNNRESSYKPIYANSARTLNIFFCKNGLLKFTFIVITKQARYAKGHVGYPEKSMYIWIAKP
jgi:hypothetical protein